MAARSISTVVTIIMNVLIAVAVVLVASVVVQFFGSLASQSWGDAVSEVGSLVTLPLGADPIKTPYGGQFDVNAAVTVLILLLAEWALSVVRSRA